MARETPTLSIVIPMKNEAENAEALLKEIAEVGAGLPPYEVIVVDDGSSDDTAAVVIRLAAEDPHLRLIRHPQSGGQSAAVHSGVLDAKGAIIATLDGDGQNPPAEIPKLVTPLLEGDPGVGLVAGQRVARQDTWSKKLASKFANRLRRTLLKDDTRDTGCGLKAFRREAFLALPFFDHIHRYLPALMKREGWRVALVDVSHRARGEGASNYTNFGRALVGALDLLGVWWLMRRRKLPKVLQ